MQLAVWLDLYHLSFPYYLQHCCVVFTLLKSNHKRIQIDLYMTSLFWRRGILLLSEVINALKGSFSSLITACVSPGENFNLIMPVLTIMQIFTQWAYFAYWNFVVKALPFASICKLLQKVCILRHNVTF